MNLAKLFRIYCEVRDHGGVTDCPTWEEVTRQFVEHSTQGWIVYNETKALLDDFLNAMNCNKDVAYIIYNYIADENNPEPEPETAPRTKVMTRKTIEKLVNFHLNQLVRRVCRAILNNNIELLPK